MSGRFEDRLSELTALPELEPRKELEPAVLAAMSRAAIARKSRPYGRYVARAAALVAAIGAGALLARWAADYDEPAERAQVAEETDATYFDLVEQTMQLEELLALMPAPRRAMRAGTASTIVGLEDQIALIDAVLESPDAEEPEYREALMRDRVEVMNALVNVRYAQSRAFIF